MTATLASTTEAAEITLNTAIINKKKTMKNAIKTRKGPTGDSPYKYTGHAALQFCTRHVKDPPFA